MSNSPDQEQAELEDMSERMGLNENNQSVPQQQKYISELIFSLVYLVKQW